MKRSSRKTSETASEGSAVGPARAPSGAHDAAPAQHSGGAGDETSLDAAAAVAAAFKVTAVRVHYGDTVPESDPPMQPQLQYADYVPEGCAIWAGSPPGNTLGFFAHAFDGYVYRYGDVIMVSVLVLRKSKGMPLAELADGVERAGYLLRVPASLQHLDRALVTSGFRRCFMRDPVNGAEVEVWARPPRPRRYGEPPRSEPC